MNEFITIWAVLVVNESRTGRTNDAADANA